MTLQKNPMDDIERVCLRKFGSNDLSGCRNLWEQLTMAHRAIYDNPEIGGSDPGRFFDRHIEKIGAENIWVADFGGQVVGLMGLEVDEDEMTIEPLVVAQPWRGKGIGSRLMETAVKEARARNATYLNVRPVARNVSALKFFHDNGMVNVGHVELFTDLRGREWKDGLKLHDMDFRH